VCLAGNPSLRFESRSSPLRCEGLLAGNQDLAFVCGRALGRSRMMLRNALCKRHGGFLSLVVLVLFEGRLGIAVEGQYWHIGPQSLEVSLRQRKGREVDLLKLFSL